MHTSFRAYIRFLATTAVFGVAMIFAFSPLLFVYVSALQSVGEMRFPRYIVDASRHEPTLWLSAYYDAAYRFKVPIATILRPEIAVFGSSRVMQMRSRMFRPEKQEAFYNLGGAFRDVSRFHDNLDRLLRADAKPTVLFLGIDWWLFRGPPRSLFQQRIESVLGASVTGRIRNMTRRFSDEKAFLIDQVQLLQQAWRDPRFFAAFRDHEKRNAILGRRVIGVGASDTGGFRNDGSYSYYRLLSDTGHVPLNAEEKWKEYLVRHRNGYDRGDGIDHAALRDFEAFVAHTKAEGIALVVFLPPIEPVVFDAAMHDADVRDFWSRFPKEMETVTRAGGAAFYDFSNPARLDLLGDTFYDWLHPGEVAYGKMLLQIAEDPQRPPILTTYLDPTKLRDDLAHPRSSYLLYSE